MVRYSTGCMLTVWVDNLACILILLCTPSQCTQAPSFYSMLIMFTIGCYELLLWSMHTYRSVKPKKGWLTCVFRLPKEWSTSLNTSWCTEILPQETACTLSTWHVLYSLHVFTLKIFPLACKWRPSLVLAIWLVNTVFHVCRLDQNYVIKVADFGLSENTYAKSYFRQQQTAGVKLPIMWMGYESLTDGIFSEKTDVVSSVL